VRKESHESLHELRPTLRTRIPCEASKQISHRGTQQQQQRVFFYCTKRIALEGGAISCVVLN
jgi:hypothetical protein